MNKLIIVAIIIVTASIAYYFVIFLPSQHVSQNSQNQLTKVTNESNTIGDNQPKFDSNTSIFSKKTDCKNICETLYESDVNSFSKNQVFNPRYTYNQNQNTCFYSGGWIDGVDVTKRVVNCQTNEEVLTYMTVNGTIFTEYCDSCVSSNTEYQFKESELMESN